MFQMYPGGQGTAVPFSTFWRMHLKLHFLMAVIPTCQVTGNLGVKDLFRG